MCTRDNPLGEFKDKKNTQPLIQPHTCAVCGCIHHIHVFKIITSPQEGLTIPFFTHVYPNFTW